MIADHGLRTHHARRCLFRLIWALGLIWGLGQGSLAQELPADEAQAELAKQKAALAKMTPIDLFGEADYHVRSGQPAQAIPFLDAFVNAQPDDATILQTRDKYGTGAFLRLQEDPATAPYAKDLLDRVALAQRNTATEPDRMARLVRALHATPEEQRFAVDRLREAGPYAVPPMLAEMENQVLTQAKRALVAQNLGRLGRSAVPALIAALDSPEASTVASAATALGQIGDRRALPYLTIRAAQASPDDPGREQARRAITQITGRDFASQPRSPVRVLTDEAWKYHRHLVEFPTPTVELWGWDDAVETVQPRSLSAADAETALGTRLAREALALNVGDRAGQTVLLSLLLQEAIRQVGSVQRLAELDPTGAYATALASGPELLGHVLRAALADGHGDLAALSATALGRVLDRDVLPGSRQVHALVEALSAPDRHARFAAAKALVGLGPRGPFPGSSRVVPVLTHFLSNPSAPKAVVIDGNLARANRIAAQLDRVGYDAMAVTSGEEGFRQAASGADVELIVVEPSALLGAWRAVDTLTNLRADARTAGVPILLLYPADISRLPTTLEPIRPHPDVEPNNSQREAKDLVFTAGVQRANIYGSLDTLDEAGDHFKLGPISAGTTVVIEVLLPSGSLAKLDDLAVTLEGTGDRVAAQAVLGKLRHVVTAADNYFVHVQAPEGSRGPAATYALHLTLVDLNTAALANERTLMRLEGISEGLPRIAPIALAPEPEALKKQLDRVLGRMGARALGPEERTRYANEAAALLAQIARRPGGPFAADLDRAGPALAATLYSPSLTRSATLALGEVPGPDAQRGLADLVLNPDQPAEVRVPAADQLARSLDRFGNLISPEQEGLLAAQLEREKTPDLRAAFSQVVGALRPQASNVGERLRAFQPGQANAPTQPDGGEPEPVPPIP